MGAPEKPPMDSALGNGFASSAPVRRTGYNYLPGVLQR
jgi:hypothetical protein